MTKLQQQLEHLQGNHFSEWLSMRRKVADEFSDRQSMFCMCGRLATGLHENGCRRLNDAITKETVKRLAHLLPRCEWVPCEEEAKWTESSGDGRLVRVCTAHRRLLNKQKIANNNV